MSIILTPFAKLLLLFYNITGSYGVSIILFGLVVRLVLSPIFLKGRKGMLAMSGLAEKQKVLAQKYARDREKYSQELTKLYEQEGVKPSSGCLWSFLPLPFLMVLYAIIRQPLTYLMNVTEDQFNVISNLLYGEVLNYKNQQLQIAQDVFLNHDKIVAAVPDLAGMPQIDFTFLGVNLSQTPSFMFWKADNVGSAFVLWLIPIVSALLGVVSMIVTNKINADVLGTAKPMDQSTKTTMLIMPLFSLWICFTLPAALGVYWIANSLFAMLQEVVNIPFLRSFLKKQEKDRAERQEQERERIKLEKKAQAEAKRKAQEEMRKIQMERKLNKSIAGASREGIRAYARGRAYDPNRFGGVTEYVDPSDLIAAQYSYAYNKYALAALLGLTDGTIPDEVSFPAMPSAEGDVLPDVSVYLDTALANRPDLRAYRETLEAAKFSFWSSLCTFGPTVSANYSLGYTHYRNLNRNLDTGHGTKNSYNNGAFSYGATASWNLFEGGNTYFNARAAQAAVAQAEYGLAEIWITVITDVRSAYDNYITYLKQVKLFQKIYDLTKQTRDLVEEEYKAGNAELTRLNEAQNDLVNAEMNLVSSVVKMNQAKAQLEAAINIR